MASDVSPTRSARYDRATIVGQLVDHLPDQVHAALAGNREALVLLMLVAADVGWQHRAQDPRQVENVPVAAWSLGEAIADCYASDTPPSDRLSEHAFDLAEQVDALALEVLLRRHQAGSSNLSQWPAPGISDAWDAKAKTLRHQARAHLVALRTGGAHRRTIQQPDLDAAQDLYQTVVDLERRVRADRVSRAVEADAAGRRDPRTDDAK